MARERRRQNDYDDFDDDVSIEKKDGASGLAVLGVAAVVLVLLACVMGGVVVGVFAWHANSTPVKLRGSWKGHVRFAGLDMDILYTFNEDGSFRQDTFDLQGRVMGPPAHGRWQWRDGEVDISWNGGTFERATVTWIDDDHMTYRIVGHTQQAQIGLTTRFKRQ